MSGDQGIALVAALMMLVLVASSLAVRRLPLRQLSTIALAWIAIFLVALGLVSIWLAWRGPDEIRLIPRDDQEERITLQHGYGLHNVYYQTGVGRLLVGRG